MTEETVIALLTGDLTRDGATGLWRTTRFGEQGESGGVGGDQLRVEASAYLGTEHRDWFFIISGGQGRLKNVLGAQSIAGIVQSELVASGISRDRMFLEETSGNTWSQLIKIQEMIDSWQFDQRIVIVSSRWHTPRVEAMIEYAPRLDGLRTLSGLCQLSVVSAESVLTAHDPEHWKPVIEAAYQAEAMKACVARNAGGVAQIMDGTYSFQLAA